MLCIFIHARLWINLWQKPKFINGNTANSGDGLEGHLMPDQCKALTSEEKGEEKGRQQGFSSQPRCLISHSSLSSCRSCSSVSNTLCISAPLRGSLPAVHLRELAQTPPKCAELSWQRFRINGKALLQLFSIAELIKLNSWGAHMDVICKSHCSLQIKANGEISLLSASCSSELLCIYSIKEILITVDMREYQS